jgi:hypothetical protein
MLVCNNDKIYLHQFGPSIEIVPVAAANAPVAKLLSPLTFQPYVPGMVGRGKM